MTFIDRLSNIMKEQNITAYRLSRDLGISESLIRQWQKNPNIEPSAIKVLKISEYFQVDIGWLLTGNVKNNEMNLADKLNNDEILSEEEKLLLQNYRDLTDKEKDELQGKAARMAGNKKSLTSSNTNDDLELGNELSNIG